MKSCVLHALVKHEGLGGVVFFTQDHGCPCSAVIAVGTDGVLLYTEPGTACDHRSFFVAE